MLDGLRLALLLAIAGCVDSGASQHQLTGPPAEAPLASEVDPFIGTAADGQTFPGAVVPWGMASPSPHTTLTTAADAVNGVFVNAGYRHGDPTMRGFGLSHLSGVGCPDIGVPVVAPSLGAPPATFDDYTSTYQNEVAYAGYYRVELGERGLVAEMTATLRTAVFRFWLPEGEPANLVVDPARGVSWIRNQAAIELGNSGSEIAGSSSYGGFCAMSGGGRLHFAARVDRGADWVTEVSPNGKDGEAMAYWRYDRAPAEPVTMWVGLSWVSVEQARANLEAEQLPFDEARDAAALAWQSALSRIEVSGGPAADRTRFYTALYHALIHPSISHDISGTYPRFETDDVGQAGGEARYTVFSLWDTYRTVHPLLTLVYPETQLDILRAMQDMTLGAAAPPKWELIGDEVQMMVGDPAAIVFADSYAKGLTGFAVQDVYETLRDAANDAAHRPGNEAYLDLGFVPMELANTVWGPVSTTLEYALSDWSLAQLAHALDRDDEAEALLFRGASYAGFFDEETGTLRPKNRDGSVLAPFDPDATTGSFPLRLGGPGYVEGTAWQYSFFAPHDMDGLISLHGEAKFVERLQWFFDTDRFEMWNEPDMGYPYLFTFVDGESQRTQRQARLALSRNFGVEPDGLPGNDDAGTMSAWFVFSAMGFYPVTPGLPEYRLGSPLFERVTIHLSDAHHSGEAFVIEAPGNRAETFYVREALLNDEPISSPALSHDAITSGGTLRLQMSATPN
ncbi:MAG: GH92 family glycosyl hydrolase [Polyangiales bacterium]